MPGSREDILRLKRCPECGYDLDGLPRRHRCPECGFGYSEMMFVLPTWMYPGFALTLLHVAGALLIASAAGLATSSFLMLFGIKNGAITAVVTFATFAAAFLALWRWPRVAVIRHGRPDGQLLFNAAGIAMRRRRHWSATIPYAAFTHVRQQQLRPDIARIRMKVRIGRGIPITWADVMLDMSGEQAELFGREIDARIRHARDPAT